MPIPARERFSCPILLRAMLFCCVAFWLAATGPLAVAADYDLAAASFLGGSGATDRVTGARVLSDGTMVLAATLSADVHPGNLTPILLNGATIASTGTVIRLSADGRKVLSVTRLATQVNDLAVDASDRLYVAAHDQGILQLSAAADTLLWRQAEASGRYAWRVDAGGDGHCVALDTTTADVTSAQPASVTVSIYDVAGTLLSSAAGYRYTLDVCLDSASQSVILCGWRQANDSTAGRSPWQISFIQAKGYDGTVKWLAYDWGHDAPARRVTSTSPRATWPTPARCVVLSAATASSTWPPSARGQPHVPLRSLRHHEGRAHRRRRHVDGVLQHA